MRFEIAFRRDRSALLFLNVKKGRGDRTQARMMGMLRRRDMVLAAPASMHCGCMEGLYCARLPRLPCDVTVTTPPPLYKRSPSLPSFTRHPPPSLPFQECKGSLSLPSLSRVQGIAPPPLPFQEYKRSTPLPFKSARDRPNSPFKIQARSPLLYMHITRGAGSRGVMDLRCWFQLAGTTISPHGHEDHNKLSRMKCQVGL